MPQVNVDPGELRRFSRDLARFNSELRELMSALNARSMQLARTWRDQEHNKFAEELDQTLRQLSRFLDTSDEHAKTLQKKAVHIEEYLRLK